MENLIIARRVGEEEIGSITKLAAEAEAFDKHKALGDHTWLDMVHGGRKGVYGFTARRKNSAQLIGYAQISSGNETWALELVVHPLARRGDARVSQALLSRSVEEIARHGGGHVHVWIQHRSPELADALRDAGFVKGRNLVQMRRSLPLEPELAKASIETRPFISGQDDEKWLQVNNRAFANHLEQGNWNRETLLKRQNEQWFDSEGFLLHFDHDRLIAFCWTKIHSESDPPLGEIYVIGVDPAYSGKGLGRKICVAGLNYLASKSLPIAMLYVDADNSNALTMYEHLGFHPDHIDTAYVTDISPVAPDDLDRS